ncbi:MAG TPA: O-antigen ligase family protein [Burkholderiaceae bacterium]
MVYAIKLLFAVLLLCAVVSPLLRRPFRGLIDDKDYWRCWIVIAGTAIVSFGSMKQVVFVVLVGIGAIIGANLLGRDTRARVTSYWMMVMLYPPISLALGGVAGINRITDLNALRVLAIVLLVPVAVRLMADKHLKVPGAMRLLDLLFISYPLMRLLMVAPYVATTVTVRTFVEILLDIWLPYYCTSRALRNADDVRFMVSRFCLALAWLASVGVMEALLRRNVYSELEFIVGPVWQTTHRLMRGPFLRVESTFNTPIIMAFVMAAGHALWTWIGRSGTATRGARLALGGLFLVTMAATFSRGPLLGWACFVVSMVCLRTLPPYTFGMLVLLAFVAGVGISVTGQDQVIYDGLKTLFGSTEADTSSIDYRRRLLTESVALIKQSPLWGVPNYLDALADMRQGEGIIDLVNTYIAVTLGNGVIGLVLFLSPHVAVLAGLLRRLRVYEERPRRAFGTFAATMVAFTVCSLITIFTTSSFGGMRYLLTLVVALPAAWLALPAGEREKLDYRAAPDARARRRQEAPASGYAEPTWR